MPGNQNATTITIDDTVSHDSTDGLPTVNGQNRGRSRRRRRSGSRSRSPTPNRNRRDLDTARRDASPLLPEALLPRQKPPQAGPEIDEEENEEEVPDFNGHGIDDGFYEDRIAPPDDTTDKDPPKEIPPTNGHPHRGFTPFPNMPPSYGGPGTVAPVDPTRVIPDINVYQHKKTLAQGMMDLALLSANANQLRYVIESYKRHPYYHFSLTFIIASLILQVAVGIGLVFNSRYNIKNDDDICKADRINNLITVGILLITIINVFVSAFGVAEIQT